MSLKRNTWKSLMAQVLTLAFAVGLAVPAYAGGSPLVTGIQLAPGKEKIRVSVAATGEIQYRVLNLNEHRPQLVIEMFPAQLSTSVPKAYSVNAGTIEKVRVGQFSDNPDVVRLVFDLNAQSRYQVSMAPGRRGLSVAVGTAEVASAKLPKADANTVVGTEQPVAAPKPAPVVGLPPTAPVAVMPVVKTIAVRNSGFKVVAQNDYVAQASRRRSATKMVNLDFVNADLIYVLKLLAKELRLNLVTSQSVKGSVTMSLKAVPAYGALNLILRMSSFAYKQVGDNTIVVGTKEELANIPEDIITKTPDKTGPVVTLPIPLENAKAASVADTIKGVFPDVEVTVQADQNFLVVKGPQSIVREIKEFVQKLDVPPPPPVVLKTEIIPIKYATVQGALQLAKTLHPNLNYNVDDRLLALIVTGQDRDIDALKAFLATIDIPLQQVALEIKVMDMNESASKSLGMSFAGEQFTQGVFGPIDFTELVPASRQSGSGFNNLAIGGFIRSPLIFSATLNMLISNSDVKVLSTPRVVTVSGQEAQCLIGDRFPVVYFDPRAGQFQVQYVDIGVKLICKPTVTADGYVSMELRPSVSVLRGLIQGQFPQTGETSVSTKVRVKDGDTYIIGGLLREVESVNVTKLPFLGDLPVLGEYFRNSTVQRTKSEVFITVTPKIMQ